MFYVEPATIRVSAIPHLLLSCWQVPWHFQPNAGKLRSSVSHSAKWIFVKEAKGETHMSTAGLKLLQIYVMLRWKPTKSMFGLGALTKLRRSGFLQAFTLCTCPSPAGSLHDRRSGGDCQPGPGLRRPRSPWRHPPSPPQTSYGQYRTILHLRQVECTARCSFPSSNKRPT